MKTGIHPSWQHDCTVTCSCGNTFITGSTQEHIQVDICSACHPFFTGEQRFVDRLGRVDRFMEKVRKSEEAKRQQAEKQAKKTTPASTPTQVETYKDILRRQQASLRTKAQPASTSTSAQADTPQQVR